MDHERTTARVLGMLKPNTGYTAQQLLKQMVESGEIGVTKSAINRSLYDLQKQDRAVMVKMAAGNSRPLWKAAEPARQRIMSPRDHYVPLPAIDPCLRALVAIDLGNVHGILPEVEQKMVDSPHLQAALEVRAFADSGYNGREMSWNYNHLDVFRATTGYKNEADTALILWIGAQLGTMQHDKPIHIVIATRDKGFRGIDGTAQELVPHTTCVVHFCDSSDDLHRLMDTLRDQLREMDDDLDEDSDAGHHQQPTDLRTSMSSSTSSSTSDDPGY